jgi:predicted dehydrogenase
MRIALFGLGFMGATHLNGILSIPGLELGAVVDAVPERLEGDLSGIQGNIGGPGGRYDFSKAARYTDPWAALADPTIDAVDLCLPTHLHKPLAVEALRRGKHVLVEKPMALDPNECAGMIAAAKSAGRVLMVAQVLRFFPAYCALGEILQSGRLGAVRSALFRRRCAAPTWQRWVYDAATSGGGVFDLVIHDVDQCLRLFGKPERVSATGCEDLERGIDQITGTLHYPGLSVVVTGGWHHPKSFPFSMEFTVVCDGGTLEYSSAGRPLTIYRADGEVEPVETGETDAYRAEIEYFAACCRDGSPPAACPPEESAQAVALTLEMAAARRPAA